MKKLLIITTLLSALALSCTTLLRLENQPVGKVNNFSVQETGYIHKWYPIYIMLEWNSIQGVQIILTNSSDKPITIIWEKSSISYRNQTKNLFMSGQKFINAGEAAQKLTIPPKQALSKSIFPADNIKWVGNNWTISGMGVSKADEVVLNICIENDESESFIELKSNPPINSGFGIWFF